MEVKVNQIERERLLFEKRKKDILKPCKDCESTFQAWRHTIYSLEERKAFIELAKATKKAFGYPSYAHQLCLSLMSYMEAIEETINSTLS